MACAAGHVINRHLFTVYERPCGECGSLHAAGGECEPYPAEAAGQESASGRTVKDVDVVPLNRQQHA